MKGNAKLLAELNKLLAEELTAINRYMLHAEMCANWGYSRLHKAIEKQAMDEMHHAEWLIERILFLDGIPQVSKLNPMQIGKTVPEMIKIGHDDELGAVKSYNAAVLLAREAKDQASVDLLTKILKMEEGHVDWAEMQETVIERSGLENYLVNQSEGAAEQGIG
ncbi:MAG TPA: bacterioferritin [Terriglobales bacterium]|nr:bacterioferritin [Terriglobales bacterium]